MTTNHTRRQVLRIFSVAASASALGLGGCDSDSNSPEAGTPQGNGTITPSAASFPQGIASGDPRPDAVVLWTRFFESGQVGDIALRLQVSTSESFATLLVNHDFSARAAADWCLKVRVTGLSAGSRYFYRFLAPRNGNFLASATGRTRTARAITDATPVKFASLSCNDYIGRYFTTLMPLLSEDLDFVLHLGDAIYETTGDPSFQGGAAARSITFDDRVGAITLGAAGSTYQAAKSLDNYRQLHRTYRNDALMQQLYQRFPVVAIWDDHEFSDDSWKAMGTYRDGLFEELDAERRRNAEQAYFEFMPVDTELGGSQGALGVDRADLYPNTTMYRKLRFGRDLELFLTDYRSYRPDHLIPEDAFPGAVVMDRVALTQFFAAQGIPYSAVRAQFSPYLDIDLPQYAVYKQVLQATLTQGYLNAGVDLGQAGLRAQNAARGNVATTILNSLLTQYNAAVPPAQQVPLIPAALIATLDTGIAWYTLGKTGLFGSVGSRYFVVEPTFKIHGVDPPDPRRAGAERLRRCAARLAHEPDGGLHCEVEGARQFGFDATSGARPDGTGTWCTGPVQPALPAQCRPVGRVSAGQAGVVCATSRRHHHPLRRPARDAGRKQQPSRRERHGGRSDDAGGVLRQFPHPARQHRCERPAARATGGIAAAGARSADRAGRRTRIRADDAARACADREWRAAVHGQHSPVRPGRGVDAAAGQRARTAARGPAALRWFPGGAGLPARIRARTDRVRGVR
ncbi:MAG: alkaline phosphatase D family protein [Xanthomonadales bacterium]|nr:alkaline phosphatase D family protein [Xanthomonadales bacterium]